MHSLAVGERGRSATAFVVPVAKLGGVLIGLDAAAVVLIFAFTEGASPPPSAPISVAPTSPGSTGRDLRAGAEHCCLPILFAQSVVFSCMPAWRSSSARS
ncbi:hypothetical protein LWC35_38430 [Pseudonocardia kujensis]|uniref:hypothetical protein n=1 Tax=Pseudonocardia kujensis TaxID=1128675 RepID=UPI001E638BC7|nr:hypothetical protein [Pseudonocardia kujensis]MCE0768732.1 hypothetical protein [Pseudonocardia kujensis]